MTDLLQNTDAHRQARLDISKRKSTPISEEIPQEKNTKKMSSACLVLQQPSFSPAPCAKNTDSSLTSLWRPWLSSSRNESKRCPWSKLSCPYSRPTVPDWFPSDGKAHAVHPVRLFWPKPKSFDYLYSDGEALLRNFPIQATISFYNDSDSDDEENWEDDGDSQECLKKQSHITSSN